MSENSYSVTSSTGWFGRIGESIKGILFGIVLILVSFPLLFWNEGRAVKTQKTLDEGASNVVIATADQVDSKNEGKLVYLTGNATMPSGSLTDDQFKVSAEALKLNRKIEIYQWEEDKRTETKKKVGGGEEKVTTYTYNQVWSDKPIDSSRFHEKNKYVNPKPALSGKEWVADQVKLGAYTLSSGLVAQINNYSAIDKPGEAELPAEIAGKKVHRDGAGYYLGVDPAVPALGDIRVTHEAVYPGAVSVIAQQTKDTFKPYLAKAGGTIELLEVGTKSSDEMFAAAHSRNRILTWILRFVGAFVMFIGFNLLFRPLDVIADFIPFVGSIVGAGTGFVSLLLSFILSLTTISIAWIFYRPLIGAPIAIVAFLGLVFLIRKLSAQKKAQAPATI